VAAPEPGAADVDAGIAALLARWRDADHSCAARSAPHVVGATVAGCDGWLAVVRQHGEPTLVAHLGGGPTTDRRTILRALELADGRDAPVARQLADQVRRTLDAWVEHRHAERLAGEHDGSIGGPTRRAAARRLATLVAGLDRARRVALAGRIGAARQALAAPAGVGADRRLATALRAGLDDETWLASVVAALAPRASGADCEPERAEPACPAIILLRAAPG
jgi:hypothetical protein